LTDFNICEQLKSIVSEFGYDNHGIIRLNFTKTYDNLSIISVFTISNIQKSLSDFEKKVKKVVPNISTHHFNLLEDTIYQNLKKISELNVSDRSSKQIQTVKYLRKFEHESILYEAITVDKLPKFVAYNSGTFTLVDKIDVANYSIHPADTIITQNPMSYSFGSEKELEEYLELAKKETNDSLFEKILEQFRMYLNAEEHTLIVLTADIFYTYFQNKFGTTHYNIFVGENGSGKNSALLVIKMLGYRPFYVTSASAANYYTFLGDVQEGQGIILEDEVDYIGKSHEKRNVLKSGYSSGGDVPKTGFTKEGNRFQDSWLTYCYKCFAMEELPGDKTTRGIFDRSFIHHFFKGDVSYNIKDIINDKESVLYKNLIHLRKLMLAFKLVNYNSRFSEIETNLTARDAELTYPLLRIFYNGLNFEKIRKALSTMIYHKTMKKSNSIEAKLAETLVVLGSNEENKDKWTIHFTNENFENVFKTIADTKDIPFDTIGSTFYFPDGTNISKYKVLNLLRSKFDAKPQRTNKARGHTVLRGNIDRILKQYQVIEEIIINNEKESPEKVTEVTEVTEFKGVSPSFYSNSSTPQMKGKNEGEMLKSEQFETDSKINGNDNNSRYIKQEHKIDPDHGYTFKPENKTTDENNIIKPNIIHQNILTEIEDNNDKIPLTTPSNSVTSVTSVTANPSQYPCYFCGTNYQTNIDFDMGNHFVEKHKRELMHVPIIGNRETKIERLISETKRHLFEDSLDDIDGEEPEDENRVY
jgi:hypothetical protein